MRSSPLTVLAGILCAGLSACSTLGVHEQGAAFAPASSAGDSAHGAAADFPSIELSGELLYQILEAEIALQRRYYDVAGARYLELTETTRDPRFAEMATKIAIFSRDDVHALQAARLWTELDPAQIEAHQMVVVASIRTGAVDAALPHIEFLLEPRAGFEDGFKLVASLLNRDEDVVAAMQLLERYIAGHGDNRMAYFNYAQFAVRTGQLAKAEEAIDRCLALEPGAVDAIALRVRVLQQQRREEEALNFMAESARRFPEDMRLGLMYARMLVDAKRLEEAIAQYELVLGRMGPDTDVLLTLGMINLQLNRLGEAEKYLLQAAQDKGAGNDAQFYLGLLEEGRNNADAAIGHYSAVAGGNLYPEARMRIVALLAGEGRMDEAREQLNTLHLQFPDQQKRLYQMEGEILRGAGRSEEAMQVLSAALESNPGDFDLLYQRAITADSLGLMDAFEGDLRAILERDPDNVDALNTLGYTLADRTDRYEEAYVYIQRALAQNPQNNAILDSMGWVLYRLGNHKDAIKYLRRSLEIKQDHEVAAHLGEVLWVSGEREEAINVWEQALELFPDDKLLLDVMKRFGQ
ncbi:MAG: tetratricopeptide repeat protein [Gammaproteobacteria bacterium]